MTAVSPLDRDRITDPDLGIVKDPAGDAAAPVRLQGRGQALVLLVHAFAGRCLHADLQLQGAEVVLEIGTGSGYQAAILAQIVYRIYTLERIRTLFVKARKLLDKLNYHNIVMRCADGTKGWKDESPYNAIMVTAGAPTIPEVLIEQLAEGGRLVVPVGDQHSQDLIKITKGQGEIHQTNLGGCRFVKLVGEHGWAGQ